MTLLQAIKNLCIERGDFTLASGQKSSYYIDLRKLTLSTKNYLLSKEIFEHLSVRNICHDAIGGPETAANQIVGGYLTYLGSMGIGRRGFVIKKEEKRHGKSGLIVGSVQPDDVCVLVEDVTTTGQSLFNACNEIIKFGCRISLAIAVVDRSGGEAVGLFARNGIHFTSIYTIEELLL